MKIRSCRSPPASFAATELKASRASRSRTPEGGALFDEEVPYRSCAEADYQAIRLNIKNKKKGKRIFTRADKKRLMVRTTRPNARHTAPWHTNSENRRNAVLLADTV